MKGISTKKQRSNNELKFFAGLVAGNVALFYSILPICESF